MGHQLRAPSSLLKIISTDFIVKFWALSHE
jgi:hypothetical protein